MKMGKGRRKGGIKGRRYKGRRMKKKRGQIKGEGEEKTKGERIKDRNIPVCRTTPYSLHQQLEPVFKIVTYEVNIFRVFTRF
jgi:hypothetical protein